VFICGDLRPNQSKSTWETNTLMNLHHYLEKKRQNTERRLANPPREICLRCFRAKKSCLCEKLKPFSTNSHFVILMHPKEAHKERNGTGRLAKLCLKNTRIEVGINFAQNPVVNNLLNDPAFYPLLLYPGAHSINIGERGFPKFPRGEKKPLFFILDGSWSLAKKIITRSKNLHSLTKISFTPEKPSAFIIKSQPHERCLSTIESIFTLLKLLEGEGLENLHGRHLILLQAFENLVNYQLACIKNNRVKGLRRSPLVKPKNKIPAVTVDML
jgi:tRNA-uridine aminocarboxypropyltransferase